jgi:hypothetical protein
VADVIFVAVICAFFALCVVYIRWCDRIVGPDGADPSVTSDDRVGDERDVHSAVATSIGASA